MSHDGSASSKQTIALQRTVPLCLAQLLALHVHSLPKRRCCEQNGVRREAEFLEQRGFRRIALQEHGEFQLSEKALVNLVHLRITGEEDEGPTARDLQLAANCGVRGSGRSGGT